MSLEGATELMKREAVIDGNLELVRLQGPQYSSLQQLDNAHLEEFENIIPPLGHFRQRYLRWTNFLVLGALAAASVAATAIWGFPYILDKVIIPLMEWEASTFSRPMLALVLTGSMAIFPLLLIPSGPSMWLAGMIFGYGMGFLIIMTGTFLGMVLPFFLGRWLLHARIQKWLERYPRSAAVIRLAEQGDWFYQFRVITILRLSPLPYPVFNYAIATTNVACGPYIYGSCTGMIPEAFLAIYSGRLLKTLADMKNSKQHMTSLEIVYNVLGLCVAVATVIMATIYGRRALQNLEIKDTTEREETSHLMNPLPNDGSASGIGFWIVKHEVPAELPLRMTEMQTPPINGHNTHNHIHPSPSKENQRNVQWLSENV